MVVNLREGIENVVRAKGRRLSNAIECSMLIYRRFNYL